MQDCFYSLQGWWSYELCLGRQLRQFHLEEGTNRPNPVIDLGHYDSEASPSGRAVQTGHTALWQQNTQMPYTACVSAMRVQAYPSKLAHGNLLLTSCMLSPDLTLRQQEQTFAASGRRGP